MPESGQYTRILRRSIYRVTMQPQDLINLNNHTLTADNQRARDYTVLN